MTRRAAPPITDDDKADIARLLPEHGVAYVAEWIGCHRNTVLLHARRMGITDWPVPCGHRSRALQARDVPGVSKVCVCCDESKPLTDFQVMTIGRFGRRPRCKACDVRPSRARRQELTL